MPKVKITLKWLLKLGPCRDAMRWVEPLPPATISTDPEENVSLACACAVARVGIRDMGVETDGVSDVEDHVMWLLDELILAKAPGTVRARQRAHDLRRELLHPDHDFDYLSFDHPLWYQQVLARIAEEMLP